MFDKINQLVKESSKTEVFLNAGLAANAIEAANHEASGVIIDVMKSQLDNGKAKDLMSFFKGIKSNRTLITSMMVKKYTNRLTQYYHISEIAAYQLAIAIIPSTVEQFVSQTDDQQKSENGFIQLLNWLSGNTVNFENFFLRTNQFQLA